jgi:hypothetical protein
MPDRLLSGSIKRSSEIDSLSWFQEVCFYRLMVTVDDHGCYYADPQIIKSDLFPRKEDLTKAAVADALEKLEDIGLIERYEVNGQKYLHMKTWEKHQRIRNKTKHFPDPPQIAANCGELQRIAADCGPRARAQNPRIQESKNPRIQESESEKGGFIGGGDATEILRDHDTIISAAESAGFPRNDATRKVLIDLYSIHGREKMLNAIDQCVNYSVFSIAYLKGVLKGEPKKARAGKTVSAQQYSQRDYSNEDDDAFRRMMIDATKLEEEKEKEGATA